METQQTSALCFQGRPRVRALVVDSIAFSFRHAAWPLKGVLQRLLFVLAFVPCHASGTCLSAPPTGADGQHCAACQGALCQEHCVSHAFCSQRLQESVRLLACTCRRTRKRKLPRNPGSKHSSSSPVEPIALAPRLRCRSFSEEFRLQRAVLFLARISLPGLEKNLTPGFPQRLPQSIHAVRTPQPGEESRWDVRSQPFFLLRLAHAFVCVCVCVFAESES